MVLYDLSYANIVLLGATLPSYHPKREKDGKNGKDGRRIKADDPRNREEVRRLIETFV